MCTGEWITQIYPHGTVTSGLVLGLTGVKGQVTIDLVFSITDGKLTDLFGLDYLKDMSPRKWFLPVSWGLPLPDTCLATLQGAHTSSL